MKVKELIKKLQAIDANLDVYAYTEDESSLQIMDFIDVSVSMVEFSRDENRKPLIKFSSQEGIQIAFIELTTDF